MAKKGKTAQGGEQDEPLTDKEEWFCREYVCDENGTQAYMRVFKGCTYGTARSNSSALLAKANIFARVEELRAERNKRLEISSDRVLLELSKLAFYDPRGFFDEDGRVKPINEMDPDHAAAIAGLETMHKITGEEGDGITVITKIKLPDKKGALELIGRNLKMWTDKQEIDNKHSGNVQLSGVLRVPQVTPDQWAEMAEEK